MSLKKDTSIFTSTIFCYRLNFGALIYSCNSHSVNIMPCRHSLTKGPLVWIPHPLYWLIATYKKRQLAVLLGRSRTLGLCLCIKKSTWPKDDQIHFKKQHVGYLRPHLHAKPGFTYLQQHRASAWHNFGYNLYLAIICDEQFRLLLMFASNVLI